MSTLRETLSALFTILTLFAFAFLAGSIVGAFIYGVKWIAGMAP